MIVVHRDYLYIRIPLSHHLFFFLMIRRPPRSTLDRSSAASDVYKRQLQYLKALLGNVPMLTTRPSGASSSALLGGARPLPVSYTHLRAHETVLDLVCRLLLEKKTTIKVQNHTRLPTNKSRANISTITSTTTH